MKHLILYLLILAAIIALSSCKKDTANIPDIIINDTPFDHPDYPDPLLPSTGLVIGKVMPESKFALTLYNDQFTYSDFAIVNRTGIFLMKNVKAGEYTLVIEPYDAELAPLQLTGITVDSARTTNLGLIFIP